MTSNFVLSTDLVEALFSGPSRLPSYYKKISRGYKRKESILHFTMILAGIIAGAILSYFMLHDVAIYFAKMLKLKDHQWIVDVGFGFGCATVASSCCFFISKGVVDVHNMWHYGVSNSQYAPLSKAEIDHIIENAEFDLVIKPEGVVRIHDTMVKFICAQRYKIERQKLKAAHWEFRRGSLSNAATMHPLMNDTVASAMEDDPLSRAFIRNRKMLSIVTDHLNSGIPCTTLRQRLNGTQKSLEAFLEELVMLQDTLEMATQGARTHDPPTQIRRSISTLSVASSRSRGSGGHNGASYWYRGGSPAESSGAGVGVPTRLIEFEMEDMTGRPVRVSDSSCDSSGASAHASADASADASATPSAGTPQAVFNQSNAVATYSPVQRSGRSGRSSRDGGDRTPLVADVAGYGYDVEAGWWSF